MSEQTTPTASAQAPVASPSPAAKSSGPGAVIRKLETATETAHERLIKKHLPAWVISGAINIGLAMMTLISVLPIGLLQTLASVEHGMWYARSAEFMQSELMNQLRWLRAVGDTVFALGAVVLAVFIAGLKLGFSVRPESDVTRRSSAGDHPIPERLTLQRRLFCS